MLIVFSNTKSFRKLEIDESLLKFAEENNFELKGYVIGAASEQLRAPRVVRFYFLLVTHCTETFFENRQQCHIFALAFDELLDGSY